MFIKVSTFSCSESSFHSPKTGRDIRTIRFMGEAVDATGESIAIHAQSGFDCVPSFLPRRGDDALMDIDQLSVEGGELQARFRDLRQAPKSSK